MQIPARMYNDVSPLVEGRETGGIQPLILACMYSRHHDGYVRQKAVARLLKSNDGFVAPYIVQMLGEYVTPIASDVLAAVTDPASFPQLHEMLRGFARENPTFVALTRKRAESYWTAYDTSTWPNRRQYPALVALDEIAPPNDRDHEVS